MRQYIRCSCRAYTMLFIRDSEADEARVEAINAYNMEIASNVYNDLMNATADYAHIRDGKRLIIYHRSTRGDFVQASHFCEINGVMEAIMHTDIHTPEKLAETFIHGKYISTRRIPA